MARIILGALSGGVAGYGWYRFVGCATGTCPISSNPYASAVLGVVMGLLFVQR
jgi:uncharacterized membrane protein